MKRLFSFFLISIFLLCGWSIRLSSAIATQSDQLNTQSKPTKPASLVPNQIVDTSRKSFNNIRTNKSQFHLAGSTSLTDDEPFSTDETSSSKFAMPGFAVCDPSLKAGACKDHLLEICRQVNGIYRCLCPENISRTPHGKCTVFNECFERSGNNCSLDAVCIDLEEGYTCSCKDGYRDYSPNPATLPGRVCVDGGTSNPSISSATPSPDLVKLAAAVGNALSAPKNDTAPLNDLNPPLDRVVPSPNGQNVGPGAASLLAFQAASESQLQSQFGNVGPNGAPVDDNLQSIDSSQAPSSMSQSALRDIFKSFDTDNNDLVSFWELKAAVELHRLNLTDSEVKKMIKVADTSGEGLVDIGEFLAVMKGR